MRRTAWTSRPARRGRRGGAGGHPGRRVHPGAGAPAAGRGPQPGGVVSDHPPPAGITLRDVRSGAHRHELVPRVSRVSDRAGVGIRVRVIAAHLDARRRPPTPGGKDCFLCRTDTGPNLLTRWDFSESGGIHDASRPCANLTAGRHDPHLGRRSPQAAPRPSTRESRAPRPGSCAWESS